VAILREINKVNRQYKVFKYYLTDDGSLYLDSCLLCQNGRLEGDMIYTVLDVIIKHLEKEYKKIMAGKLVCRMQQSYVYRRGVDDDY